MLSYCENRHKYAKTCRKKAHQHWQHAECILIPPLNHQQRVVRRFRRDTAFHELV